MKYFNIDEDTINTLLDLLSEASTHSEHIDDRESVLLYQYLIGELEDAKMSSDLPNPTSEEIARMKKVERYLRMLQKGLKNPKDDKQNKRRRSFAKDILKTSDVEEIKNIEPYFDKSMSMKGIEQILKNMTNLTDVEKFELYCQEKDKRDSGESLDSICKQIGLDRYDSKNK